MSSEIDIDVVADIGEAPPEASELNEEEMDMDINKKEDAVVDYVETALEMKIGMKSRITIPYLTKYEKTRLIGFRSEQLNRGAMPTVKIGNLVNTILIAEKELEERTIPLKIIRKLPNGVKEEWRINELNF